MAKKILIVEDEHRLADMEKMRLESSGYEVVCVYDGQAAIDKVHQDRPDLIVLDIMLPKIDGYKVCRMLKFDAKYKDIPIIMLSARAQDKDKAMGSEVGANAYLTKPFQADLLIEKIRELLKT